MAEFDAGTLSGKSITVIVSGGIAAYKACELVRGLIKAGADVKVAMTEHAAAFVGPMTFEALTGHPAALTEWPRDPRADGPMPHIDLARCDLMLAAPATANLIAKAAHGVADDLASTLLAARRGPTVFMPAMNMHMWANPATQKNVQALRAAGCAFIGPAEGFQACGDVGAGRMTEPADALDLLQGFFAPKLLAGRRVLVTAGGTFEAIDPVRGITNRSSGRQGIEIARAARDAGAAVTLVAGLTSVPMPSGVRILRVESALDMHKAVMTELEHCPIDVFFGVAAVADWRPSTVCAEKIKKTQDGRSIFSSLTFTENPDILADVARRSGIGCVVGFAAESAQSEALAERAREKLVRKGADLIVANDARTALGASENVVRIFSPEGASAPFGPADKAACARWIIRAAADVLTRKTR